MQSNPDFDTIIGHYTPEMQEVAIATRAFIFEVLPATVEVPWVRQKIIGYGTGPKKKTEHFSWLALAKKHITLGFCYGAELPDPEGLLEGTGKLYRHVKIKKVEDLQRPGLRALMDVAIQHRVPPPKQSA